MTQLPTRPTTDVKKTSTGRRTFLKAATAAAAASTLTPALSLARSAHSYGSDEIKIVVIGAGGRGSGAVLDALHTAGPVRVVAVADAFEDVVRRCVSVLSKRLERAKSRSTQFADKTFDVPPERQFFGFDAYKKALATDCDLVILTTPPGFRPLHFAAAVAAGKHVFMEKPVATDAKGIREVLAATRSAKEKNLAVGVGLQRRHERRYQATIERLQDGAIGDILLTRAYWNGTTPWVRPRKDGQTEMEYQMRNWYYFNWLCGDHIVEQHIHNLDVINWLKGGYPVEGNGMGGCQVRKGRDFGETFDHHFIEFTYADGSKMYSQCRHIPGCYNEVSEHAHGTKGYCNISGAAIHDHSGSLIWEFGRGGGGGHQQEHHDLFADLRAGRIPNEGEYGALSTMTAIFGRMLTYSGQKLTWDQALNSQVELGVRDFASFDEAPPVLPDADGKYALPVPGRTKVV
ncbi:MAG: gfo/Idh/MocA family oxidoreductase [Planctomycetota bacterium]|nr:MAG: gfo/Idh/MocA family oxidoreductase [Planctomycetota bacterium]REK48513.1 MAG: gfo/Idh/MocA family oxidoreductase [Planctomycetota bacterium]